MVVAGSGPVLALSRISHGFSRGKSKSWVQVLRDAHLELELGEVVAVVGGRLAGKTTLLRIAAGLDRPDSGTVRLGEVELTELRERDRGRIRDQEVLWLSRVGISQKVEVSKIVSWMLPRAARRKGDRRVAELLDRVGAAGCASRRWGDLSSWEQVLVAFAQAFAAPPRLIVIDDLLDALGEPATRQAFDLLRMLIEDAGRSCGVLISASDMDAALYADRVWSLERGRLVPTTGHRQRHAEIIPLERRAHTNE